MLDELKAIGITNPWAALQSVRNFALTVWDPTRSDIKQGVNALVYGALRNPSPERIRKVTETEPELVALYESGYDPDLDLGRLERLPDGSLGREYARLMRAQGLDPLADLLALGPPTNVLEYAFRRAYKLHDLMHVALGCDTSVLGEVRIVSFSVGQATDDDGRAAHLALAVLFLHLALRKPAEFPEAVRLAGEWLRLGAATRLYVTLRLEDWIERPVGEVREIVLARGTGEEKGS
ncbi:MAG: Coq4 family protein, partial [Candidatus Binatia bacterium]